MTSLDEYVATWRSTVADFLALGDEVPGEAWSAPTALPGWDAFACLAHTAHLEGLLAGQEHRAVEIGEAAHAVGMMGKFTEEGVVARRGQSPAEALADLRHSTELRDKELTAHPPNDPEAPAPGLFGLIGWTTERLLKNRPLDIWMHEQDIREAVGLPGNLHGPGAAHTVEYLLDSMVVVFGKRARPAPGSSLLIAVDGHDPRAWVMGDDGRAVPADPSIDPTATLAMDGENFTRLAGGRRTPQAATVTIAGDRALAARILDAMAVTP